MNAHSREDLARLIEDLPTKSAKIRKLDEAGLSRSEIAKFLGLRYQHVRNVLVADEKKAEASRLQPQYVKLDETGRVVIPAPVRGALGLEAGDSLLLCVADGVVTLQSVDRAVENANRTLRKHRPEGVSLVDELIAERRAEAQRE